MNSKTEIQYREVIASCKDLFVKKTQDYGSSWRVLRLPSLTDQIYIKIKRIRYIQESGTQKIADSIRDEFVGIVNYCAMALIQIKLSGSSQLQMPLEELLPLYDQVINETQELVVNKNHDYNEAWREMRISSMTDIILMKILRMKQIEKNDGKTVISEGVEANYKDIINYSVFCLISMDIK